MTAVKKHIKDRYDKDKLEPNICNKYRKQLTAMKCFQCPLTEIVRDTKTIGIIEDAVKRMNRIVIHTYRFLKCYCLFKFHSINRLPVIDEKLIILIMKTIASADGHSKFKEDAQNIMSELEGFNQSVYSKMSGKLNLSYTSLSQMIHDQSKKIITAFKNHIQEHFDDLVKRYVNIISNKNELILTHDKKEVLRELQKVKNDILKGTDTADSEFTIYTNHFRTKILDDFPVKNSLEKMAEKHDMNLLLLLIRMSIDAENIQRSKLIPEDKDKQIKVINCFPIRSSIIPGYVDIDGQLIVRLLLTDNCRYYEKNITKLGDELWSKFFKTDHSLFRKKGYKFDYRISTDGIGCSIQFLRSDISIISKKSREKSIKKPKNFRIDKYINMISENERNNIFKKITKGTKSFIGIDPGKRDLIFCTNGDTVLKENEINGKIYRKTTTFAYSNGRRKEEMRSVIVAKRLEREKQVNKIANKTIKEIEQTLSDVNSNSCIWNNVIKYMKAKNSVDLKLQKYYEHKNHRIRKWYTKINKRRSESNMINRFEETLGSPDDVVILMGDWSENRPMRFQEPTMGKSIRRLFRNRGYTLYLVDEFNTSKRLINSGEEMVKFRKDTNGKSVHRVLTTALIKENSERTFVHTSHPNPFIRDLIDIGYKPTIINRDLNGSLNIRWKGMCHIFGLDEPDYMNRSKNIKRIDKSNKDKQQLNIKISAIPDIPLRNNICKSATKSATKQIIGNKFGNKNMRVVKTLKIQPKVVIRNKCGYNG